MLGAALAHGTSVLKNALESDDTKFLKQALIKLGVSVRTKKNSVSVKGAKFKTSKQPLFCGNAGTAVRFLSAVLATQPFPSVITGNKQMKKRPIGDLLDALRQLGAIAVSLKGTNTPPIKIEGPLLGGTCCINGNISSQFLSGLLLASPLAKNDVTIQVRGRLVSKPYVDLTISVMKSFGILVQRDGYRKFFIRAGQKYRPQTFEVEGDASSASYFWGISALTGEPIEISNVPKKSLQADAIFREISLQKDHFHCENFPDSAMTLIVLSALLKRKTVFTGLENLRVKECDRIKALSTELQKIGCRVKELHDGLVVYGNPDTLHPASIKTYNDHRMAMCFGMLSVVLPGIKIENPGCVSKTYPNFWKDLTVVKSQLQARNLILTGMRGSGKSKLGSLLGRMLGRRFVDIDDLIEEKERKSIPALVASRGWKYFRMLERKAVKKIMSVRGTVIATGGGTLMNEQNLRMLKKNGKIIFLKCPLKIIRRRIAESITRPSLTGKKSFLDELEEIYEKRKGKYQSIADATIDTSQQTHRKRYDFDLKITHLVNQMKRWGMVE